MRRYPYKTRVGEATRHRTRIDDEPSPKGTDQARIQAHMLLRSLIDTPDLMLCGGHPFESIKMQHDGERWIFEAEAQVSEPEPA